ncbi:MAG: zeta toxin family protein [Verrucomicrobiota bacterium]
MSTEESTVEERFAVYVEENLEELVSEYQASFGNIIDTDRAREFSEDYRKSIENRTRYSRAVYKPAKALADEVYFRRVREPGRLNGLSILFTSGGTGAGKSTALAALGNDFGIDAENFLCVDGTLSDLEAAREKIREAIALNHEVTIVHVHRNFEETVKMVVNRAMEMGRAVALDNIAATHFRSKEVLFRLAEEFEGQIEIRVIINSTQSDPTTSNLEHLRDQQATSIDDLRDLAHAVFENEFQHLKHDRPEIYKAFVERGTRL